MPAPPWSHRWKTSSGVTATASCATRSATTGRLGQPVREVSMEEIAEAMKQQQ